MIPAVASACLFVLFLCLGLNLIRIYLGPTNADRAVATDVIFLNLVGITALYSIFIETTTYFDLVLVFSLLGFIGIAAFSKFLGRGRIIE